MSNGKPPYDFHGMNVTWREYVDLRFQEFQRAIEKAEVAMTARLESMNEFRSQLKDQTANFVTKEEADHLRDAIDKLRITEATLAGKASQNTVNVALLFSVISTLVALASFVMRFVGK